MFICARGKAIKMKGSSREASCSLPLAKIEIMNMQQPGIKRNRLESGLAGKGSREVKPNAPSQ